MTIKAQEGPGTEEPVKETRLFLRNKDRTYSKNEVDVRLASGEVIKARAATGGWMGPTKERPYPDFEEVTDTIRWDHGEAQGGFLAQWKGKRIPRIDLYMAVAQLFAARSTCLRGQVGCVAVRDNRIIAVGYNGSPPGMPHCLDVGCSGGVWPDGSPASSETGLRNYMTGRVMPAFPQGCLRAIHAEANLVAFAARVGVSLEGCSVFATHGPCLPCAQVLVASGITRLTFQTPYRLPHGLELVKEAGVEVTKYEP